MKKTLAIIALFIGVNTSNAQSLDVGIKAGLNFSKLSNTMPDYYSATNGATGFMGGVYGRVGILGFFAQPEILYSQRKGAFTSKVDESAVINTLSYLDVPVLFGYKLIFARFYVGPNFQFLMGASQDATNVAKDPDFSKDNFKSSVIGVQGGVGIDLRKLSVDIRYDAGGALGNSITTPAGLTKDYGTKANMWQVAVGFKLF